MKSLDGIWHFLKAEQGSKSWQEQELSHFGETLLMPVPSSYNDITTDRNLRDHVGAVWYERKFFVPISWTPNRHRVWLRFGSVHYHAVVVSRKLEDMLRMSIELKIY